MGNANWPHQDAGLKETREHVTSGSDSVVVTSPTGGGKSRMMAQMIEWGLENGMPTTLYTHRRLLLEQTSRVLTAHGIEHGIRASGHEPALLRDVQLAMIQSETIAVYDKKKRDLHKSKIVLLDEAHCNKGESILRMKQDHARNGAAFIGWTATPLDLGGFYHHIVHAGKNSDLRRCGAHVPCHTYGPDMPDLDKIKREASGEYKIGDVRKIIMTTTIFGRVYEWWMRLNPEQKPTLLFGPDVAGSLWFAEQFYERGISTAHIDGKICWINGEQFDTSIEVRDEIKARMESGDIKICCNRFVLREGVDWPFIAHGIFATMFGGLTGYLQAGGRLLRSHPSLDHVILQDHGGNFYQHGSLNDDRHWELGCRAAQIAAEYRDRMREKKDEEPLCCPKCSGMRLWGRVCPHCGFEHKGTSRMVVQIDGSLREMTNDVFTPRRRLNTPTAIDDWRSMYHRAKRSKNKMTFLQAEANFARENNWRYPPRDLPLMPLDEISWTRRVCDVPLNELR